MPITPLPIANGFYEADSLTISAQECTNWFPVLEEAPALNQETLRGTPGLYQIAQTGTEDLDANRGAHVMDGVPYFVNKQSLYRLNSNHTVDNLGTIAGAARVSMDDNGTQLMILQPGGNGYIFTTGPDTLTQITDADFTTTNGAPQHVVFIDGYFCCTTDDKKFIVSSLNDGLTWSALDVGSAESNPDGVVKPIVFKNQLFIAGERTIEGFTNIGGSAFPFQRSGLFMDEGVFSPFSAVNLGETVLFIGGGRNERPAVWQFVGNQTQRISTHAIDNVLDGLSPTELDEVFAWTYSQAGHYFAGFTLPDTTFVYDTTTGRWHERKSSIIQPDTSVVQERFRVNSVVKAYGNLYAGDNKDGRIGILDTGTYDEYDEEIRRQIATQPFQNNMEAFTVPSLELTVESGVGNVDVPDPVIRLQVSRDGGYTWADERERKFGLQGERDKRLIWRRNGKTERFDVYRFILSDAVKPVIGQLTADIRGLP